MQIKKYLKINKLSMRGFARLLNDPLLRKKFKLCDKKIAHSQIANWIHGVHKPNMHSMKILQRMTHGQISMKDFVD